MSDAQPVRHARTDCSSRSRTTSTPLFQRKTQPAATRILSPLRSTIHASTDAPRRNIAFIARRSGFPARSNNPSQAKSTRKSIRTASKRRQCDDTKRASVSAGMETISSCAGVTKADGTSRVNVSAGAGDGVTRRSGESSPSVAVTDGGETSSGADDSHHGATIVACVCANGTDEGCVAESKMEVSASSSPSNSFAAPGILPPVVAAVPVAATTEEEIEERQKKRERSKSVGVSSRLDRLSKPKPLVEQQLPVFEKPVKKMKFERQIRPSVLVRVRPLNVPQAMALFLKDTTVAPIFTCAGSPEVVSKAFKSKSEVDFSLFDLAKSVLNLVLTEHGGPETYMQNMFGGEPVEHEEMVVRTEEYLKSLRLQEKVIIRTCPNMLSAANVVKPSPDGKFVVNLAENPVAESMVESICDHEIGTHLLRMLNDEHQAWHEYRGRYGLSDPWVTEEGLATINTYRSIRGKKIMYPQALKYYAACRGSELGFCELYAELEPFIPDPKRRFRICCRVKRGLRDTSASGAFNVDQAYFKGAVAILRKLGSIDFSRLYAGQLALEDLDKVRNFTRKEVVRLPLFLNSPERLNGFLKHCRQMIADNKLEVDPVPAKGARSKSSSS